MSSVTHRDALEIRPPAPHSLDCLGAKDVRERAVNHQYRDGIESAKGRPQAVRRRTSRSQRIADSRIVIEHRHSRGIGPVAAARDYGPPVVGKAGPCFAVDAAKLLDRFRPITYRRQHSRITSDAFEPCRLDLRSDIVEHDAGNALGLYCPEHHSENSTQRGADDDDTLESQRRHELPHVGEGWAGLIVPPMRIAW